MTVYFTSDLHLGHRKVAELRGFDSIEAHDEAIRESWRDVVARDDVVWILGDLTASKPDHALDVLAFLPGRKRLILGNHDPAHPMYRDAHKWLRRYFAYDVFEHVAASARVKVDGVQALLSHFPYGRDRGETRYAQWRLRDEGLPLIHGHTHGPERLTVTPAHWSRGPRVEVHVGLDAWDLRLVPDYAVHDLLVKGGAA